MLPIGISILHLVGHIAGTDDSDENAIAHEVQDIPDVARDATKGGVAAALVSKGKDAVDVIKEKPDFTIQTLQLGSCSESHILPRLDR